MEYKNIDFWESVNRQVNPLNVGDGTLYASLNVDVKGILKETASNLAAIYVITYDMGGYTSRVEAEDMINVLRDAALRNLALLRDKKTKDFMSGA